MNDSGFGLIEMFIICLFMFFCLAVSCVLYKINFDNEEKAIEATEVEILKTNKSVVSETVYLNIEDRIKESALAYMNSYDTYGFVSIETLYNKGLISRIYDPYDANTLCSGYAVCEDTICKAYLKCGNNYSTLNYSDYIE